MLDLAWPFPEFEDWHYFCRKGVFWGRSYFGRVAPHCWHWPVMTISHCRQSINNAYIAMWRQYYVSFCILFVALVWISFFFNGERAIMLRCYVWKTVHKCSRLQCVFNLTLNMKRHSKGENRCQCITCLNLDSPCTHKWICLFHKQGGETVIYSLHPIQYRNNNLRSITEIVHITKAKRKVWA